MGREQGTDRQARMSHPMRTFRRQRWKDQAVQSPWKIDVKPVAPILPDLTLRGFGNFHIGERTTDATKRDAARNTEALCMHGGLEGQPAQVLSEGPL